MQGQGQAQAPAPDPAPQSTPEEARLFRAAYPALPSPAHVTCQPCANAAEARNAAAQALHELQVRRVDLTYEMGFVDEHFRRWAAYDAELGRSPATDANRAWLQQTLAVAHAGERSAEAERSDLDRDMRAVDADIAGVTQRLQAADAELAACPMRVCPVPGHGETATLAALNAPQASSLDDAVLAELNAARGDPAAYAAKLRRWRANYQGRLVQPPGDNVGYLTQEGTAAVDEAIAYLEALSPRPPLASEPRLYRSAQRHAVDQGPPGLVGHTGSDGSSAGQRMREAGLWAGLSAENISFGYADAEAVVRQLIIDDGVPGRGHRANIFDPGLNTAGVGCGQHQRYGHMCVIDFAGAVMTPVQPNDRQVASAAAIQAPPSAAH
jgi:uncharacterized protein YkwD